VLRPRRIAALTSAFVLALPGAAFAGGAGDDQYQDPFGDEPTQSEPQQAPDSGAGAPEAEPAPAAPAPDPGPAAEAAPAASPAAPALPRTGADAALVALAGGTLVLAGAALRRRTADDAPR
jgi:LPXTG-motif cell wall-anchored protein